MPVLVRDLVHGLPWVVTPLAAIAGLAWVSVRWPWLWDVLIGAAFAALFLGLARHIGRIRRESRERDEQWRREHPNGVEPPWWEQPDQRGPMMEQAWRDHQARRSCQLTPQEKAAWPETPEAWRRDDQWRNT